MLVEEDNDKRTIISLREIGDGKIDVKDVEVPSKDCEKNQMRLNNRKK